LRDFLFYSSFKFVRKFNFCVSPVVKRYPGLNSASITDNFSYGTSLCFDCI